MRGRPVVDHLLERLAPADEIRVVVRPAKRDLIEHLRGRVTLVEGEPRTVAESLALGLDGLAADDLVLVGFPDTLFDAEQVFERLLARSGRVRGGARSLPLRRALALGRARARRRPRSRGCTCGRSSPPRTWSGAASPRRRRALEGIEAPRRAGPALRASSPGRPRGRGRLRGELHGHRHPRVAGGRAMKVLVTGHHGYIGSVAAPFLAAQGHEVTGLDTLFYRGCDLERRRRGREPAARRPRPRRGRPARLRRDRPPGRALERPARRPRPGADLRDQRARQRAPGPGRPRGRRRPLRLRLVLLDVRRLGRGARHRGGAAAAGHALRRVEGARRGGDRRARRRRLLAGLPALRDGVRRLAAAAPRHRAEQPRRLGAHDREGADPQRRHALAADRPHRGHRPHRGRAARGAARGRPRRGLQRRRGRGELPGARPRRDRARDRAGLGDRVRRAQRPRPAQLPGRLRQARARAAGAGSSSGARARARRSSTTPTARPGSPSRSSRARASRGSSACSSCARRAGSTTTCAGRNEVHASSSCPAPS